MNEELHITGIVRDFVKAISIHHCADVTEQKIRRGRLIEICVCDSDARRVIGMGGTTYRALVHLTEACKEAQDFRIIMLPVKVDKRFSPPIKPFKPSYDWDPSKVVFPLYLRILEELGSGCSGWKRVESTNVVEFDPEFPKLDSKLSRSVDVLANVLAMPEGGNVVTGHED